MDEPLMADIKHTNGAILVMIGDNVVGCIEPMGGEQWGFYPLAARQGMNDEVKYVRLHYALEAARDWFR